MLDKNCEINNGKSNNCLFCKENYKLKEETNLCEEIPEKIILFCEIMKGNICVKCINLYYTLYNICAPISDPDCSDSLGIEDQCF